MSGIQRESETVRRGSTTQELRVSLAFCQWTMPETGKVICFECGHEFFNWPADRYPQACLVCGKKYNDVGMYCLPDITLDNNGNYAVVFVNGKVHENNAKRKAKDKYQIKRLTDLGYKVFIIKNEEIDNLRISNLLAMTKTIYEATGDMKLYQKLLKNEKEF